MTTKPRYLYRVTDAAGNIRYVGCSTNPSKRLKQHINEAKAGSAPSDFGDWLIAEIAGGRSPALIVVGPAGDSWESDEQDEIARAIAAGARLLNGIVRGQKTKKRTGVPRGLVTTRFGPRGSPDRDALEALLKMGQDAKPVPVNANQMVRLAVREYVERHVQKRKPKGAK